MEKYIELALMVVTSIVTALLVGRMLSIIFFNTERFSSGNSTEIPETPMLHNSVPEQRLSHLHRKRDLLEKYFSISGVRSEDILKREDEVEELLLAMMDLSETRLLVHLFIHDRKNGYLLPLSELVMHSHRSVEIKKAIQEVIHELDLQSSH